MGKVKYIKCPRCELNYIPDTEDMCDVCKAEMGLSSRITLLDDMIDEDEPTKLCPICKTAYIGMDEDMCENCLAVSARTDELEAEENDDDWRAYMDDEVDDGADDVEIPLDELKEEFGDDDDFEDDENYNGELEDYPDDLGDIDDYDEDEDFDDDEEEDNEDETEED